MSERKNIFMIGRRTGNEDQLTEMLAFLWQENPGTLDRWLQAIGLPTDTEQATVETQFVLPNGKRPDISVRTATAWTLVESKLGAGFGSTQIADYLAALSQAKEPRRALVLLTQKPEPIPTDLSHAASENGVGLISQRWHDMAEALENDEPDVEGVLEEGSLSHDFITLLIREGLVKPDPLNAEAWATWNAGYNTLLKIETFLDELDPHVQLLQPASKKQSGSTRRWVYRVWRADALGLGLGFGAAASDRSPHTDPIIFAFVGNSNASPEMAKQAVLAEPGGRQWWFNEQLQASCGLIYEWPALARPARSVLRSTAFEEQVVEVIGFLEEARNYYRGRGFLPT